ncbi:plasmid mobilization protein [Streptococcus thoraltensis]|uniref:plasmid mobilization protein n=1 Tax=Streptococcus thoraltensis TaxID=55085 RepID=UPI001F590207|nr:plasmid mobilization relaxosome protein MobC [Streptococcus thoraltensis]
MGQKKRKRYVQFILRTKDEEADKLRRRITLSGKKTFQAYALNMLLEGKVETYDYSELKQLRIEVNRIGQNINQLVRYANTFQDFDQELFVALQEEVKELQQLIVREFKEKEIAKKHGSDQSLSN